jgi:hypothetical protein
MDACCMEAGMHACGGLGPYSLVLDPFGLSDACSMGTYSSLHHGPQVGYTVQFWVGLDFHHSII